ncbi:MAG: hypothetical protein KTR30_06645 [Saprospiraceae bacterium]|nr:hypothetical protein [Saprospiraceae bacterium]
MKNALLICLLLMGLGTSCTIEDRLERKEDRLLGTWYFDRAFYKEDGDLFRDNVINEFEGDLITFFDDYTALYEDYSLNAAFDGGWEMFADRGSTMAMMMWSFFWTWISMIMSTMKTLPTTPASPISPAIGLMLGSTLEMAFTPSS